MAEPSPRPADKTDAPLKRAALARRVIERVQRLKIVLAVATVDLEVAIDRFGAFSEHTWSHRRLLADARRAWERVRADLGQVDLGRALARPPIVSLPIGGDSARIRAISIGGQCYLVHRAVPVEYQLRSFCNLLAIETRPSARPSEPYRVFRLRNGDTQCDCADWYFRIAEQPRPGACKHIAALESLGWL